MKLSHRISLLIFIVIIFTSTANFLLTQYQEERLHKDSEKILARTIIQSLRDALVQDVIDGNKLRVTNLLRTLRDHDNPIDFLYVTQGDNHDVFAHSFRHGFPRYLLRNKTEHTHLPTIELTGKYQTDNGLIYEYSEPLLKGLDTVLHIGINQSEIAQKLVSNQKSIILMSGFIMFIALLAAYLWSHQITAPLALFARKIQAFGSGAAIDFKDIKKNIPEIRVLAQAFETAMQERQQALQALQEREKNLDITLNSIGDAVITTDAQGNITRMNPVATQLTGWSNDEAFGQSVKSVFPIIDATTRKTIENPVEKVISTGQTIYLSNHTTLISRSGIEYQIADSAAPIRNEQGKILGMVLVFNDVTEQYQLREIAAKSKRDMQSIMDHSPSVIYVKDTEGRFTFVNQRFEELFQVSRETIQGKTDHDQLPQHFIDVFSKKDQQVLSQGTTLTLEEEIPQDNGIYTYFSVKFPLLDNHNQIYAICSISTDITEQRKTEETLRRSQKMEAIGQLSGGIAHDFNNQLGVVIGYLDFLKQHTANEPKAQRWVDTATKATLRCIDLTRQLLAFSRKQSTEARSININDSLNEFKNMIARSLTPEVEIEYYLAENLWSTRINNGEFQDAILNLVINARDAMPRGGKLLIETSNTWLDKDFAYEIPHIRSGEYVQLMVSDTGQGMDHTTLEHIFEPFFTTKTKENGTGLGMSMVYGFVKRYHGYIKAYSEPGKGTTIRMYLPRTTDSQNTVSETHSPNDLPRGSENVLIVDDEPELLQLAAHYLKDLGYNTFTSETPDQAIKILANHSIDILFSDVVMPGGINGFDLAQAAVAQAPHIKVLLTSGFTSKAMVRNKQEKYAAHLLPKPYRKDELAKRLRLVLDNEEPS